jgi:RNA polymerase sigma-70 factor (ECF subfamily)
MRLPWGCAAVPIKECPVSEENQEKLEVVFGRHQLRLLALVKSRMDRQLATRVQAEDILQEAFLKALRHWDKFKPMAGNPEAACYAWLEKIVLGCLFDEWDKQTAKKCDVRKDAALPDHSSLLQQLGLVNPPTGPSTAAARAEEEQQLRELLRRLKSTDREVLELFDLEGRPYAEVATLLNIDEGTARVRHTRALRRLKDLWKQTYPGEEIKP